MVQPGRENLFRNIFPVSDEFHMADFVLISIGYNTTLTLRTHNGTIPSIPQLGNALSGFVAEIPTPKLTPPKSPNDPNDLPDDEDRPRFIADATVRAFFCSSFLSTRLLVLDASAHINRYVYTPFTLVTQYNIR